MNHFVSIFCLIGFVYQLGASTCGCLEGNYWHQALVTTGSGLGMVQQENGSDGFASHGHWHDHGGGGHYHFGDLGPSVDSSSDGEPAEDDHRHDCECDCHLVYWVTKNFVVEGSSGDRSLISHVEPTCSVPEAPGIIFAKTESPPIRFDRTAARAKLGVFLL